MQGNGQPREGGQGWSTGRHLDPQGVVGGGYGQTHLEPIADSLPHWLCAFGSVPQRL